MELENRLGEVTPIYIYSNCASVELFVNGDSKGVKKKMKMYIVLFGMISLTSLAVSRLLAMIVKEKNFVKKKYLRLMFLKNYLCLPIEKR
ncbi:MAG: hypothetical protein CM15mP32_4850 [Flavobacteriaceae bacterium]|nr:MAG: hypothetical protein CM15mP32_4850 [Flavobacteriaceae bacterium]